MAASGRVRPRVSSRTRGPSHRGEVHPHPWWRSGTLGSRRRFRSMFLSLARQFASLAERPRRGVRTSTWQGSQHADREHPSTITAWERSRSATRPHLHGGRHDVRPTRSGGMPVTFVRNTNITTTPPAAIHHSGDPTACVGAFRLKRRMSRTMPMNPGSRRFERCAKRALSDVPLYSRPESRWSGDAVRAVPRWHPHRPARQGAFPAGPNRNGRGPPTPGTSANHARIAFVSGSQKAARHSR